MDRRPSSPPSSSPRAVSHDPETGTWLLRTPGSAYGLRVGPDGIPRHVHWGGPLTLGQVAGLPVNAAAPRTGFEGFSPYTGEELPVDGGDRYGVPSLQIAFADGTRAVEWAVAADGAAEQPESGTLLLHFSDPHYPLRITLGYRVHPDTDAVERWTELRNASDTEAMTVLRADSGAWSLPPRDGYRMTHVAGLWAAETQVQRHEVPVGETVLGSRTGATGHRAQPWVMLDAGDATETGGQVWSTALAWSGSWRLAVQRGAEGRVGVTAGAGLDGAAVLTLQPGEVYTSPSVLGLYSAEGFGGATRAWHRHIRAHVLPHPAETRPVLYNSWEATYFDVTETGQRQLAALAASVGVELFVMDDGWFGSRRGDSSGLGDWTPYPGAFPNGLQPLVDEVHRLGMRFGLWVEPEMVNPDSDLYRAHPDWVLHFPHRVRTELRNQLVLNFGRPEVADWAYGWLTALVARHGIDYLKWDFNRPFSEAGWPDAPYGDQDRVLLAHVRGYHSVLDRLRADHPGLRIEACSGGGGRVDLAVMARTDQVWISDNTDASDRLTIQDGYSHVYPVRTMAAWVTDVPNHQTGRSVPLRFRFHSAMAGVLALGGRLTEWTAEELKEAAELVAEYKEFRHVVQHGELHRLRPVRLDGLTAVQYLAPDAAETVVLGWRRQAPFGLPTPPLPLRGLDRDASYRNARTGEVSSGAVLLEHGLDLPLPWGDWSSAVVHLVRL